MIEIYIVAILFSSDAVHSWVEEWNVNWFISVKAVFNGITRNSLKIANSANTKHTGRANSLFETLAASARVGESDGEGGGQYNTKYYRR